MKNAVELNLFVHRFKRLMESEMEMRDNEPDLPQILQKFARQLQQIVDGEVGIIPFNLPEDAPTLPLENLELLQYFYDQRDILEPGVLWTSVNTLLPKKAKQ